MSEISRLPIVGVMGSGCQDHADKAVPLGRWLARQDVHLLTGGGRGVMACVSRAFFETRPRAGLVIGVLPGPEPPPGYPNPYVEVPIRTHLSARGADGTGAESRNAINILSADVVIALPGGAGTISEIELARRHDKPLLVWDDSEPRAFADVQAFVGARLEQIRFEFAQNLNF